MTEKSTVCGSTLYGLSAAPLNDDLSMLKLEMYDHADVKMSKDKRRRNSLNSTEVVKPKRGLYKPKLITVSPIMKNDHIWHLLKPRNMLNPRFDTMLQQLHTLTMPIECKKI